MVDQDPACIPSTSGIHSTPPCGSLCTFKLSWGGGGGVAINVRPVNYAASVFVCKSNKLWTLVLPTFTAVGVHQVENKYVTLTLLNDLNYWVKE